jgi:hypothetical protein
MKIEKIELVTFIHDIDVNGYYFKAGNTYDLEYFNYELDIFDDCIYEHEFNWPIANKDGILFQDCYEVIHEYVEFYTQEIN